jgi:hypothetical protein
MMSCPVTTLFFAEIKTKEAVGYTLVVLLSALAAAGPSSPGADGRLAVPSSGFVQVHVLVQELNITDGTVRLIDDMIQYIYDDVQQIFAETYIRSVFESTTHPPTAFDEHVSNSYTGGILTTRWAAMYGSNTSWKLCNRSPQPYSNGTDIGVCRVLAKGLKYGFFDDVLELECMVGLVVTMWAHEVGAQCIFVSALFKQSFDGIEYTNRQFYSPLQSALPSYSKCELSGHAQALSTAMAAPRPLVLFMSNQLKVCKTTLTFF